ncbi:MAG: hypothetical protein AAF497_19600 [Planctomycetota bacterium]
MGNLDRAVDSLLKERNTIASQLERVVREKDQLVESLRKVDRALAALGRSNESRNAPPNLIEQLVEEIVDASPEATPAQIDRTVSAKLQELGKTRRGIKNAINNVLIKRNVSQKVDNKS